MALTPQQIEAVRKQIGYTQTPQNVGVSNVARRREMAAQYDAQKAEQQKSDTFLGLKQGEESYPAKVADNIKETFKSGAGTIMDTLKKTTAFSENPNNTPLEKGLKGGQALGNFAGTVAGTAGGLMASFITPFLKKPEDQMTPEARKQQDDLINFVKEKIDSTPILNNPEIQQALGDVFKAVSLKAGAKAAPEVATTANELKAGATSILDDAGRAIKTGANDFSEGVKDLVPETALPGAKQTVTDLAERFPRAMERVKTGAEVATQKAAKIKAAEPAVADALKVNLDERIINTIADSDDATRKAFKQVVDIAEETPTKIGMKKQPSIVSGELATKQYDLINKQKKSVGQQIGDKIQKLSKNKSINIDDSLSEMQGILSEQGVNVARSENGLKLDFSGSNFTPAERARVKELFDLATEGGETMSPKRIHAKDQLFSKLQREARMEGVGDILVETAEGKKSIFNVFRDIYSKKLEQIAPEIKPLNREYRNLSLITDDIEDSIFKTPNFNAVKSADPAEFAKVNLRRIFGEAQSSPAFEAVADKMDTLARQLGYQEASPKAIAEFAQELRKLYPESIPKTGFTGGIRMGLGDLAEKALNVGAPNFGDQRKALIKLLESYLTGMK